MIEGLSTPKGIEEYLILLSVCQTCKYSGLDFLGFLRSGETDIGTFAASQRNRAGPLLLIRTNSPRIHGDSMRSPTLLKRFAHVDRLYKPIRRRAHSCVYAINVVFKVHAAQDRAVVLGVSLARKRRGRKSHATNSGDWDSVRVSD